ncbi:MAG TPA: triose-phosphate isomerase [Rhodospirillaceae bacterium]|nr:triose-phosphate isomerase [Rhodospirillaceae bacterium]
MTKRRKLIVGNWKMNGRLTSGLNLAREVADKAVAAMPLAFDVVLCPPATLLWPIADALMGTPVLLGAQDCHYANHGAYTGDLSAGMLADLGCRYVILGHSERRAAYGESGELISKKVTAAQLAGLTTIVCVGETLEQRASGATDEAIVQQLSSSLPDKFHAAQLVIAYEPVWAIGSGEIPSTDDIRAVHRLVRRSLGATGDMIQVIYGGSVVPNNAEGILQDPDIDGVLVGSASLNSDGFWAIAERAR